MPRVTATPQPDECVVILFRPKRFFGSALTPSILVDGTHLARLDNGRYVAFRMKAGKSIFRSSMKTHADLEVELKPGTTHYFEMVILAGNWRGGGRLLPVPEADAKEAMKKLKPLDQKWIDSKAMEGTAVPVDVSK